MAKTKHNFLTTFCIDKTKGFMKVTKTRNKLKIMGTVLSLVMMVSLLAAFSLTASAEEHLPLTASYATEATDVYWYFHAQSGTLLLSSEKGSSGYIEWSKNDIAAVENESDVPWDSSRASIKSVTIYSPIAPPSTAFWFKDTALTSFSAFGEGMLRLDMSLTTDASRMFAGCSELEELDLSAVSAPLVQNIESAFADCSSLKALDISCFDGAPISNMMNAFYKCSSLKELDISYLAGAPIVDMTNAFYGCSGLESLNASALDISRVTDFSGVFQDCAALKSLDLSALDGRKITTLANSFNGCSSLSSLTFGDEFTCENVTDMTNTFASCKSLTSLDISGFSTTKVTNMSGTFSSCEALEELTLGAGFVCSSVTNMQKTFSSCKALTSLDTSDWNALGVKNMNFLFSDCAALKDLDLSGFSGAAPTDIKAMFKGAASLSSIDLSEIDTSAVTSLEELFYGCTSLEGFDFSMIDTSEVTSLEGLFYGCTSLESFDLSRIDTSAVKNMANVFKSCTALTSFSFAGVNTSNVETMQNMFSECTSLTYVDFEGIDSAKVTSISSMFFGCSALKRLELSDFDFVQGLSLNFFLRRCYNLEVIYAPKSIPEGMSIPLDEFTFYNGEAEITALTKENEGKELVRKFSISYLWKNGNQTKRYELEPSYYYYGYGATVNETVSENGYSFDGWRRNDSGATVTEITETDTGTYNLYAKLTAYQPVAPDITVSDDVIVTYGDGFSVKVDFAKDDLHTYRTDWYRTTSRSNAVGFEVTDIRNTTGFTIEPKHFKYGITIETETYFYCAVTVTRTDNGLTKTVKSAPIKVYVQRAQAEITLHPTAIEGLVYNGSAQEVATRGESSFGNVVYSFYKNHGFTMADNKQTNAGSGILYYYVAGNNYYNGTQLYQLEYSIEAATPTVSWNEESIELDYSGNEALIAPPSVSLLGTDTYEGAVSYSYTGTSSGTGLPVNAGTYSVIASTVAEGNYKAASSEALTLVINKVAPEFAVEPSAVDGLIYNGGDQALAQLGEAIGGEVEFSLDQSSWSGEVPKGKNAGEYTVYYRIKGDLNHLDGAPGSLEASIEKKSITVTAEDKLICVNGTYTLTYGVEGIVNGEALPIDVSLSTNATVGAVGNYGITVSGAKASDNYTVTYEGGTLTVREHAYNNGAVTTAPSCMAGGEMTYTCSHDSTHTYTEPLPVDENAHAWNEGVVTTDPTCSAIGTRTFTCTHNSAHTYTEDVAIDENAHAWNEGVVTTDPTCSAIGTRTFTCTHNSAHTYTEDVAIDENAHSWNEGVVTTNPTCTALGTRTFTCTHNSAHTYTEDVAIDENAHAWNEGVVTTNPTCTALGIRTFTCTHNSAHTYTEDVAIDENAHSWDEGVVTTNPTCSAIGTRTFTCTHNSAHTYTEDVAIDENAHAWNEGTITKQPTCTERGVKALTCAHNVEHTKTEDIDALGHKYDNDCDSDCNACAETRTPTEHLDADGDRVCDECGAELSEDGLSGGAIAGIVIGSIVALGGGFALLWFVIRKKR